MSLVNVIWPAVNLDNYIILSRELLYDVLHLLAAVYE